MNDIFYVYKLIDPVTLLPFYIGKGSGRRIFKHEDQVIQNIIPNNNKHLFHKINKIIKHGQKIIYEKVIENVNEETAFKMEIEEIHRIGRHDLHKGPLCNLTNGGDGISGLYQQNVGEKNPMYGKNHTDKTKKIISEKRRSRIWDFHHSEDHKNKLKINNPGAKATSFPVIQLTKEGLIIREWKSCTDAAKTLFSGTKCCVNNISKAAKNNRTYNGFIWVYKKYFNSFDITKIKIRDGVKQLIQKDINGNVIKQWKSIKEAILNFNCKLSPSGINWASKNNKKYKGYFWKIYD